jgi:hypothetical protein
MPVIPATRLLRKKPPINPDYILGSWLLPSRLLPLVGSLWKSLREPLGKSREVPSGRRSLSKLYLEDPDLCSTERGACLRFLSTPMNKGISESNLFHLSVSRQLCTVNSSSRHLVGYGSRRMEKSGNAQRRPHFHIFLFHTQQERRVLLKPR